MSAVKGSGVFFGQTNFQLDLRLTEKDSRPPNVRITPAFARAALQLLHNSDRNRAQLGFRMLCDVDDLQRVHGSGSIGFGDIGDRR